MSKLSKIGKTNCRCNSYIILNISTTESPAPNPMLSPTLNLLARDQIIKVWLTQSSLAFYTCKQVHMYTSTLYCTERKMGIMGGSISVNVSSSLSSEKWFDKALFWFPPSLCRANEKNSQISRPIIITVYREVINCWLLIKAQ